MAVQKSRGILVLEARPQALGGELGDGASEPEIEEPAYPITTQASDSTPNRVVPS